MSRPPCTAASTKRRHRIFHSHNLGSNAGGVFKGVYLARTGAIVNEATGKVFKAGDFQIGVVAKLPSVSLKVQTSEECTTNTRMRTTQGNLVLLGWCRHLLVTRLCYTRGHLLQNWMLFSLVVDDFRQSQHRDKCRESQ